MVKTIVVLANSRKHTGRCIAGRTVSLINDQLKFGDWIRPVSSEGEIKAADSKLKDGGQPQLLDIIQIPVIEHCPIQGQPENYLVDPQYPWKKIDQLPLMQLGELVEQPTTLWLEDVFHTDYVTAQAIVEDPPSQSLYLIRPENLCLNLYWWEGKKRVKTVFLYNGTEYELQTTDSLVWEFASSQFPDQGALDKRIKLPNEDNYYLCVSLAGLWELKRRHYKLVAAIIDENGRGVE